MPELAINGGSPVRAKDFPAWPIFNQEEYESLKRVLESRNWFSGMLGADEKSEVWKFENSFKEFIGSNFAVGVANGSAALEIALKSVGVGAGDEVIVPALTFIATATAALQNNAIPIMVDIEPDYYCIDPNKIEEAITSKTSAIVPVHFGGQVAQMDRITKIARKHRIPIVEDAAHAHGSIYNGEKAGSFGEVGCFSFQESKVLTAGEGGVLVTDNPQINRLARSYRSCGREEGRDWYEHFRLGWNYRMTEFQGAILSSQLLRLPKQVSVRTENAQYLSELLRTVEGFSPVEDSPEMEQNAHYYYIVNIDRDYFPQIGKQHIIKALNQEGIPCNEGYPFPLPDNPMFEKKNWDKYDFPYRQYTKNYDPQQFKIPIARRACHDTIIIPQEVLLAEAEDMCDIAAAFEKISKYRDELYNR